MMVGVSLSLYLMLSAHLNPPQASLDFYRLDPLPIPDSVSLASNCMDALKMEFGYPSDVCVAK